MNPKPSTYSAKRKRKLGEMNADRRTRWAYRIWVAIFGKPQESGRC